MTSYATRPLSDRTWLRPAGARRSAQFDSTWTQTLRTLYREVDYLDGRDLVIEVDVSEADLKLDGTLRARAKAASPAVVVAFETAKHGPMLYRADKFVTRFYDREDWHENVRAVALTLERLRDIDRYGATDTGQQYAGFKALPAGRAMPPSHMTSDEAFAVLLDVSQSRSEDGVRLEQQYRRARAFAHPDRHHGDRALWDKVEQAAQVLGVAS